MWWRDFWRDFLLLLAWVVVVAVIVRLAIGAIGGT
jgi:hypothetical protein